MAWIALVGMLFIPAFPDPPLRSGAYVQDVRTDAAVLACIDAAPQVRSAEVWDAGGSSVWRSAGAGARRRHAFAVRGLQAAREYTYAIRGADGEVEYRGRLRTPPADDSAPVHFCVVGDSGGLPWWIWMQNNPLFYLAARNEWLPPRGDVVAVADRMAEERPAFWLHVGDVAYPWGHQEHYNAAFFRPFAALLADAPCYLALGNHDVLDDRGRQALANFHLPRGEWTGDERCYAFSWGSVRIVVLDLNAAVDAGHPALGALRRGFAGHAEPWRVVVAHHPVYSASRQGDRRDLVEHLAPALIEAHVDLLLVGHDHNYQRFAPLGGVRGPVMVVTGGGGKSLYDLVPHSELRASYRGFHFLSVEVAGPELRVTALGTDGSAVDRFALHLRDRADRGQRDPTQRDRDRRVGALLSEH